jgi:hypothetical protein
MVQGNTYQAINLLAELDYLTTGQEQVFIIAEAEVVLGHPLLAALVVLEEGALIMAEVKEVEAE